VFADTGIKLSIHSWHLVGRVHVQRLSLSIVSQMSPYSMFCLAESLHWPSKKARRPHQRMEDLRSLAGVPQAGAKSSTVTCTSSQEKVVKASGTYLVLDNGQIILDATGGAAVVCIGHSHLSVKEAIATQMNKFSYCHSLVFNSDVGEDLCKLLVDSTGG
jgi:4-aminobutyrate aminotransferase-like enzyme